MAPFVGSWHAHEEGLDIQLGYPHAPFDTLVDGQTYHIQGWTIVSSNDGTTFTSNATGHGVVIDSDQSVPE
jgi:hypothetical protein